MSRRGRVIAWALAVPCLFVCVCMGLLGAAEVPLTLAFGWLWYVERMVPKLNPDPGAVVSAFVCLLGVVLGGHAFLRWLYAASCPESRRWPWKWTLQVVGVIVLMFIAGIAVTGMVHQSGWLIRSPEPVFTGGVRDSPARSVSANHMKQILIGAHGFLDNQKAPQFPRSRFDATGRPLHSWQTALHPYVEQGPLYNKIDRSKPWTHPDNAEAMSTLIREFLNPAVPDDRVNGYGASHYAGDSAVVLGDTPRTLQSFPQGASNIIFVGEVTTNIRAWGDPLNARDPRLGANAHPDGFGAPRGRPPQFAMLDGSVRTFDPKELADLAAGKVPE